MKVSVLMPVYNERWTVREILRRVYEQSGSLHEVVAVDDGSTDGTVARLRELQALYGEHSCPLRVLYKDRNEGKGAALKAGMAMVTGDVVIIQDADLEYDPKDYARLLAPIRSGQADAVFGSRFIGGSAHRVLFYWHSLGNLLLTHLCNLFSDLNLTDVWTGYKVFRADILRGLELVSRGFGFEPEVTIKLARCGCRIYEVPIGYDGRTYEEGKKIGLKDALTGTLAMLRAWLTSDIGPRSANDQALRITARAGQYHGFLFQQLEPYLGREVIEVGSGTGSISRLLLDRDRLVLTEAEPRYLAQLASSYKDWGYVQALGLDPVRPEALPGSAGLWGGFDSVVSFHALSRIADDAAALRTMHRLLKPGGRTLLMLPAHQSLFGSMDKALAQHRRYDAADVRAKLQAAGFEVELLRFFNPVAVPGWWLGSRIRKARLISDWQLDVFYACMPLVRWLARFDIPFGLVIFAVGRKDK
ncbi:MAG: glycosyltransferase [Elusimicrobiota bacterium]|jgi:SAM-dependent methyltransferase